MKATPTFQLCLFALFLAASPGGPSLAGTPLPRSTPEEQGISSAAVRSFLEAADGQINTLHSFMLVRHGHVIAEAWWKPESADTPHVLWSLSKSFNATAVGLAAAEGKLSLEDPVLKFFPDEGPADPSANLKAMRVRDLLTMSGGHDVEPKFDLKVGPSVKDFLAHPVTHQPGTWFRYNTPGSYTLSAIVTKATGQTVLDYLKPRLFEPLGIDNPKWESSAEGYNFGDMVSSSAPKTLPSSASSICRKANGRASNFSRPRGSKPPPPSRWTTTKPRVVGLRTGSRATDSSSGAASTAPTEVTVVMGRSASSCRSRTPSSRSPR
ncbi:MAG: serine hydrolase domain-containing protein [Verrucomicrobiales bacterium]